MNADALEQLAKALARRVEWSAELSRQAGYAFPKKYDFGVSERFPIIRLRVDDVRCEYVFREGSADITRRFTEDVAYAAGAVVSEYISAHPEHRPGDVNDVKKAVAAADRVGKVELFQRAAKAARKSRYIVKQ